MHQRILIPLDGSKEAEGVLKKVQKEVAPGEEIVLLHVVPHCAAVVVEDEIWVSKVQQEEAERAKALFYLNCVAKLLGNYQCRSEVVVADSVCQGILNVVDREGIDLIAMYTHDRKGLARLLRGSIASDVRRRARVEVRVYPPAQVAAAA